MSSVGKIGLNIGISLGLVDRYFFQVVEQVVLNEDGVPVGHVKKVVRTDKLLGVDETVLKRTKALMRPGIQGISYLGAQLLKNPRNFPHEERGLIPLSKAQSTFLLAHFPKYSWSHPDVNGRIWFSEEGKLDCAFVKLSELKEAMEANKLTPEPKEKWKLDELLPKKEEEKNQATA